VGIGSATQLRLPWRVMKLVTRVEPLGYDLSKSLLAITTALPILQTKGKGDRYYNGGDVVLCIRAASSICFSSKVRS